MLVTVKCKHCQGSIELDPLEYRNVQYVTCPHCQQQTDIQTPRTTPTATSKNAPQAPKVRRIEDVLDYVGEVYYVVGFIIGVLLFVGGLLMLVYAISNNDPLTPSIYTILSGLVAYGQGFVVKNLFAGGAEVIRLLRKISERN